MPALAAVSRNSPFSFVSPRAATFDAVSTSMTTTPVIGRSPASTVTPRNVCALAALATREAASTTDADPIRMQLPIEGNSNLLVGGAVRKRGGVAKRPQLGVITVLL